MEKIKVNMSPNPLDVQTIHASQNDGEARQWEFELHNNGELIDTSDVTEQLVFKAYKGGTEQLLPENGSTPTTSPFLGDIRYPQGLLTDQKFTYRQSPTEEDGLAKITDIKGNTLVWNQISVVPFTEVKSGVTFTRSDDRTALQMSGTSTSTIYKPFSNMAMTTVGHVYYVDKGADSTLFQLYNDNGGISTETNNRRAIGRATAQKSWYFRIPNGTTIDVTAKPMIIDLTQMFGETKANEILAMETAQSGSGIAYITSLFPLPFYDYNAGTLLSFNGTGIKTANEDESEEHTTTLPILTYFPTGMKSAGTVYDELTPTKAITRIGAVDLGSLDWTYTEGRFQTLKSNISPLPSSNANVLCSIYSYSSTAGVDKTISQTSNYFRVYDSSFTDATAFKTAMSGVYLYYELATPTETSFTTASLVTENTEIPLSNEDGVLIGKCTEQLSENPGFIDAKIKLTDSDGTCYSNKLQLHVERSPQ